MNTLLLSMLGAVAEFERSMILERQREGIAIAKAAGKYKGRKASLSQTQAGELLERLTQGESVTALATEYGLSPQTVYNYKSAGLGVVAFGDDGSGLLGHVAPSGLDVTAAQFQG